MKYQSLGLRPVVQVALVLCLLVFFAFQISTGRIVSNADFASVQSALAAGVSAEVYPQQDQIKLRRVLGMDPSEFTQAVLFRLDDAMSANEMVLVQYENDAQREAFEQAAQNRISSQHEIYAGYAPEQAALMEQALVDAQGNYGLYYVGDNPQAVMEVFEAALRNGGAA